MNRLELIGSLLTVAFALTLLGLSLLNVGQGFQDLIAGLVNLDSPNIQIIVQYFVEDRNNVFQPKGQIVHWGEGNTISKFVNMFLDSQDLICES